MPLGKIKCLWTMIYILGHEAVNVPQEFCSNKNVEDTKLHQLVHDLTRYVLLSYGYSISLPTQNPFHIYCRLSSCGLVVIRGFRSWNTPLHIQYICILVKHMVIRPNWLPRVFLHLPSNHTTPFQMILSRPIHIRVEPPCAYRE